MVICVVYAPIRNSPPPPHACVHGQMHSMSAHITTSHTAEADLLTHWYDGLAIATGNKRQTQFLNIERPSVVHATCVQAHPLQSSYWRTHCGNGEELVLRAC